MLAGEMYAALDTSGEQTIATGLLYTNVVSAPAALPVNEVLLGNGVKLAKTSGVSWDNVVKDNATTNITTGYTATFLTHAQGSILTPVISNRQWIEVTGSGALTINPPIVNAGGVDVFLPSAITPVTLGGFSGVIGADGTGDRWLSIRRTSTGNTTAIWVANA
jgi:hypothetical protein